MKRKIDEKINEYKDEHQFSNLYVKLSSIKVPQNWLKEYEATDDKYEFVLKVFQESKDYDRIKFAINRLKTFTQEEFYFRNKGEKENKIWWLLLHKVYEYLDDSKNDELKVKNNQILYLIKYSNHFFHFFFIYSNIINPLYSNILSMILLR